MFTGIADLKSSMRTWNACRWRSHRTSGTPGSSSIFPWLGFKRLEQQQETACGECFSRHLGFCRGGPGLRFCCFCPPMVVPYGNWKSKRMSKLVVTGPASHTGSLQKTTAGVELEIVSAEGFTSKGCGCNCGCTLLYTSNVSSIYE